MIAIHIAQGVDAMRNVTDFHAAPSPRRRCNNALLGLKYYLKGRNMKIEADPAQYINAGGDYSS